MEKAILQKSFDARLEVKSEAEDGKLHIRAYALAFGNVDSYGDIIKEGACDEFLKSADADRMALCYQHDRATVIGVITDKGVDAIGMWIEADILPTTEGKDVQILIKNGAVKEFSIGYYATEYHYEKREGYDFDLRILDAITVIEVSPVTRAANPKAILTDMKSEEAARMLETLLEKELEAMKEAVDAEYFKRFANYFV